MRRVGQILAVMMVPLLAGCQESGPPTAPPSPVPDGSAEQAQVVIGLVDSGINAYHVQFRDHGPNAWRHPSTYIAGYPLEAEALRISLNETEWTSAVQADCSIWNAIEADTIYWIPGTRIIGLRVAPDWFFVPVDCQAGELPIKGLDTLAPHGTGAASRATGTNASLCPECLIFMAEGRQNTEAMLWLSQLAWVDVQSNSWGGPVCDQLPEPNALDCGRGDHESAREATANQVTFASSGNGLRPDDDLTLGIGSPAYLKPAQGHEGVILVGGHDNGEIIVWPGSMPHVVADAWSHPAAAWNHTSAEVAFGGTSGAAPFAAGVYGRLVLEARRILGDNDTGLRQGNVAITHAEGPFPEGPLGDGTFSRQEAEHLFRATALSRPEEDQPFDGLLGCPLDSGDICVSYSNDLGPWNRVPAGVPAYYFIGYGQVGSHSLASAMQVLEGTAAVPDRTAEDAFFGLDAQVRRSLQE